MIITEENLKAAHKHSSYHRREVEASAWCGCFYCRRTFYPQDISDWINNGETALCPHCGIDSVVGTASGVLVIPPFLEAMHDYYFKR